eukprot:3771113-Rhodomonas_salina.1
MCRLRCYFGQHVPTALLFRGTSEHVLIVLLFRGTAVLFRAGVAQHAPGAEGSVGEADAREQDGPHHPRLPTPPRGYERVEGVGQMGLIFLDSLHRLEDVNGRV